MRDVDGQTTLHAAVKKCYPKITSILLAAADPKGLQMENSVGNTILDIASLNELSPRIQQFSQNSGYPMTELGINDFNHFYRYSKAYIQQLENELPKLHSILDVLFADGRLKSQTTLATELTKFAKMMGERLSAAKAAEAARAPQPPKEEIVTDVHNPQATLSTVLAALKDVTVSRQLVHLIDVQKSVGADLEKVNLPCNYWRRQKVEDGLEAEQSDEDGKEKGQSMVWQYIYTSADRI